MTREERVGIWIISIFVILAMAFYGMAIVPGLSDFLGRQSNAEASTSLDGLPPEFAVAPQFGSLIGQLLDAHSRAPMINPSVTVFGLTHIAEPSVSVDPDGRLRIQGLPVGRPFDLHIERPGYAPESIRRNLDSNGVLDLGDILMRRMVVLEGRVQDGFGRGIVGSRVSLYPTQPHYSLISEEPPPYPEMRASSLSSLLRENLVPIAESYSDRTGRFDFGPLTPGIFDMVVTCPDFIKGMRAGIDLTREARRRFVDIDLSEGIPFVGRLIDDQGNPISGATVLAAPSCSGPYYHRRAASNAEGIFRFEHLAPGPWAFAVQPESAWPLDMGNITLPTKQRDFKIASMPQFEQPPVLPPGTRLSVVPSSPLVLPEWQRLMSELPSSWPSPYRVVRAHRQGGPMDRDGEAPLSRKLLVRDADSWEAIEGALLFSGDHQFSNRSSYGMLGPIQSTNAQGRLTLIGSPIIPESWLILAEGYQPFTLFFPLEGDLSQPLDIDLKKATRRSIKLETREGRPVPYAMVHAVPPRIDSMIETLGRLMPQALEAETDEKGIAELWTPNLSSDWRLIVSDSRGWSLLDVDVETLDIGATMTLSPGAWIEGSVRTGDERTVDQPLISVSLPAEYALAPLSVCPRPILQTTGDRRGRFRIGPIPAMSGLEIHAVDWKGSLNGSRTIPQPNEGERVADFNIELRELSPAQEESSQDPNSKSDG